MSLFLKHLRQAYIVILFCCSFAIFLNYAHAQENNDEFIQDETLQTDPVKLFNQGQDAHAKGELKKALEFYNSALKEHEKFPEAEYQKGNVLVELGRFEAAEKAFRRALKLRSEWALPLAPLGSLLVKRNNFVEAKKVLEKAIDMDPANHVAYIALTDLLLKTNASRQNLQKMYSKLVSLTSRTKTPASIWLSKGMLERKLGKTKSAKASIRKTLIIEPKNKIALSEQIEINLAEKQLDTAIRNSKNYLQKHPTSNQAKFLLARSYNLNGNSSEALCVLDSIKNPTKNVLAFRNIIRVSGSNNISDLEKLLETDKNNTSILGRLCLLSRAVNPQKALDYCKRALDIEKNNIKYAIGYSAALVQLKKYLQAIAVLRNLQKLSPDNYTIRANLATALFQVKRFEEAKAEYSWITKNRPKLAVGYYFLAISHDRLEEYKDAMRFYKRFLQLASSEANKLEIEKVNLRIPILEKQIKSG